MSGNKRSEYQQEMDQVQLSKEKADETLQVLLKANREIREEEVRKSSKSGGAFRIHRFLPVIAAAAACLVLVWVGLNGFGNVRFDSVRISQLPVSGISRGDDGQETDFETAFGCTAESLFPGWAVSDSRVLRQANSSGTRCEGVLHIEKEGVELIAEVTQTETALYTALQKSQSGFDKVRLNLDPDTGVRYAAASRDGLYVMLSSGTLTEKEFVKAVREIAGAWNPSSR